MCTLPRIAILPQTIEMFEQPDLIRLLIMQIIPPMLRPIAMLQNAIGPRATTKFALDLHEIRIRNVPRICKCQRVPSDRFERPPHPDYLPALPGGYVPRELGLASREEGRAR